MTNRPWRSAPFAPPDGIPTMISEEEMQYLHWLTADCWDGRGDVVEVGPWLGGSTWCLAAGMRANSARSPDSRLHVVDNFVWRPFMSERAPLGLAPEESFRSHFERNLAPMRDVLEVHEAALPDDSSADKFDEEGVRARRSDIPELSDRDFPNPIAIAFVDGAKSLRGLVHFLRTVAPRLSADSSLLVLQDYKNWSAYWVALLVGLLVDGSDRALEPVHVLPFNTVTFRVGPDLQDLLPALPTDIAEVSKDEGVRFLARGECLLRERGDAAGAATVSLGSVTFLGVKDSWPEAADRFGEIERTWPLRAPLAPLARSRAWLEGNTEKRFPPRARARAAAAIQLAAQAPRRAVRAARRLRAR